MSVEDTLFDEALKWRLVARDMRMGVKDLPCRCVETPEYIQYMEHLSTLTPGERLLFPAFEGDEVVEDCPRCKALTPYEKAVGVDAVFAETPSKITPEEREAFREAFVQALIEYINKEDN